MVEEGWVTFGQCRGFLSLWICPDLWFLFEVLFCYILSATLVCFLFVFVWEKKGKWFDFFEEENIVICFVRSECFFFEVRGLNANL